MRRIVVFMGGFQEITVTVQRVLAASLDALAGAGVRVPTSGRRRGYGGLGLSHQPLATPSAPAWDRLADEIAQDEAETWFLVIPGLHGIQATNARGTALAGRLNGLAEDTCLVSVVADQLTLINDYYLEQVSGWRLSKRLESSMTRLLEHDAFKHERLRSWYDDSLPRYAAVPADRLDGRNPVAVLLEAAGVELPEVLETPVVDLPPQLGPVGVEAGRLLSTYLPSMVTGFKAADPDVRALSTAALTRAQRLGWCADPFWGWTPQSSEKAIARFDASNQRFARAVWGTEWTLPYPTDRPCTQVDFLDLEDFAIEQVQRFVTTFGNRLSRSRSEAS